ncbi:CPBP family intramembrane glutamic endopeptidase [Tamlana sp. 2201CG12-4]|uniref:CPBP family intramembrane glutamic endopeptidase n=1 Tax=Tamlana sp. 2201CG12-4 TaxID=3112582 RepID=UPI002DBA761E|nr:CPBP family intramembrane glutamic endopeptidase [Tamlana sp. 2201CG12-4]MEC3908774.1 CPBP family intramembrane glutamic endopeptidase [Tamlana sp. 2201CG12-4]
MNSTLYRGLELLLLFVLIPVSFVFKYSPWIKLGIGVVGFLYVIYVLLKVEHLKFKIVKHLNWTLFWKETFIKLSLIAVITFIFVWVSNKEALFQVVYNKPKLWLLILFIYSVFSVYPQELIYRTFFFSRYRNLFKNNNVFLFINAILFSLAHLFFRNALVIVLTFLGGLLFALTYNKTQSTILVSIEHAVYGCWLFTVGMGVMLGFPA